MPAAYQDLYLEKGSDFIVEVTLTDNTGVPYDLTNFTVTSQARKSYYSANSAIDLAPSIVDYQGGIVHLSANSTVTSALSITTKKLVYDVNITEISSGLITRVLEGQIFVSPSATH
jgi:hypothetical protein